MNPRNFRALRAALLCFFSWAAFSAAGSAFTYQGRLLDGGANGSAPYDLRFTLYNSATAATPLAGPVTNSAVSVSNGLFITQIDFGSNAFTGTPRWLEIGVRAGSSGAFTPLSPRQEMTPAPLALTAEQFTGILPGGGLSGTYGNPLTLANPANQFIGNGGGLTSLNGANLLPGTISAAALADNSITTPKLQSGSILATHVVPGQLVKSLNGLKDDVTLVPGANISIIPGPNFLTLAANSTAYTAGNGLQLNGTEFRLQPTISMVNDGSRQICLQAISPAGIPGVTLGVTGQAGGPTFLSPGLPTGVFGDSAGGFGVLGASTAPGGSGAGVFGIGQSGTPGVMGTSDSGHGVRGFSSGSGSGIYGENSNPSGFAGDFNGNLRLTGTENFGTKIRELITLGSTGYGVGFQSGTFYFRAGDGSPQDGFAWFRGGSFSGNFDDPGPGGKRLMELNRTGLMLGSDADQPVALEIGNSLGFNTSPSLDFHYGVGSSQDYNVRLVNDGFQQLSVLGILQGQPMMQLNPGGMTVNGQLVLTSDRNAKENFVPINPRKILEKVAALPLTGWSYKVDPKIRHLGPVAQDFYAAFGLGPDDRHIATVDADGVALAAIQGLHEIISEKEREIIALQEQNRSLETRLLAIEKALQMTDRKKELP